MATLRAAALLLAALLAGCTAAGLRPRASAAPALAPLPAAPAPEARPTPQRPALDRPIQVRSRSLRYDQRRQETVFYGGVTATQEGTLLVAGELRSRGQSGGEAGQDQPLGLGQASLSGGVRLVSRDPYGVPLTLTGRSALYTGSGRSALLEGGVRLRRPGLQARAGRAEVEEGGARLRLRGAVRASQGLNRLQAEEACFDQVSQSLDLQGGVRARLLPSQLRAAAAAPWSLSANAEESE